jgi:hypothetical protein
MDKINVKTQKYINKNQNITFLIILNNNYQ